MEDAAADRESLCFLLVLATAATDLYLVRSMRPQDQLLAASAFVVVGLVTLCVSLPLIYRKVRINRFYGIRIPQAFVSEARWYEINEYGGRLLARWSWPITLAGIVGFLVPLPLFPSYLWIALGILFVSVFAPLIQTIRWARATRKT